MSAEAKKPISQQNKLTPASHPHLYQLPEEAKQESTATTPDWMQKLLDLLKQSNPGFDVEARMVEHTGKDATYPYKATILQGLEIIYNALTDNIPNKKYSPFVKFNLRTKLLDIPSRLYFWSTYCSC